jgi:hypothetical protein
MGLCSMQENYTGQKVLEKVEILWGLEILDCVQSSIHNIPNIRNINFNSGKNIIIVFYYYNKIFYFFVSFPTKFLLLYCLQLSSVVIFSVDLNFFI